MLLLWSESPTTLHLQNNKIQIVILAFNGLQIYSGLLSNPPTWIFQFCHFCSFSWPFYTFTHVLSFVLFPNLRFPCYFSLSMQSLPFKPIQIHFHTEYLLGPLQPLAISPTTNCMEYLPIDHLFRMLSHNVITRLVQNIQHVPCIIFKCLCAISSVSVKNSLRRWLMSCILSVGYNTRHIS